MVAGRWPKTPGRDLYVAGQILRRGGRPHPGLTAGLVFGIPELVADISRIIKLEPGDMIATGTPGGVGMASGEYLRSGDSVTVAIGGVGEIRSRVE